MEFSSKTKNRTTIWPRTSNPVHIYEKKKKPNSERYMSPSVHSIIIYNCQGMEATYLYPSVNKWIEKKWWNTIQP